MLKSLFYFSLQQKRRRTLCFEQIAAHKNIPRAGKVSSVGGNLFAPQQKLKLFCEHRTSKLWATFLCPALQKSNFADWRGEKIGKIP
jgi:hypothetical protein